MTDRLQDLFTQMLTEEPAMEVTPGRVLGDGRRLRRRRRVLVRTGSGLAAVLAALTGIGVLQATGSPTGRPAAGYPVPAGAVFVAPGGDDAAAGTEGQPLATLRAAVGKAPAGGTVVLRGGAYREDVGAIDKRVTIQPYGTEDVQLKGSDVVPSWVRDGRAWRAEGWSSPLCQSCYPTPAVDRAHPLAGQPDQVFRDGVPLTQVASRAEVGAGTFFVDLGTGTLYVGDDPGAATIEASVRWRALQLDAGAAGSVLRGLHISEYAPHWNQDQLAAVIDAAPGSVLQDNTFTRNATRALGVFASGVLVQGNRVVDNGGPGGTINRADGVVIRNNDFSRNNTAHYSVVGCGAYCTMAGLKISHTAGITVDHNTFDGNDGSGLWCDLACTDAVVTGNTATGNSANGLFWDVSSHATLAGNKISGNGRGVEVSGSDRITLSGNTISANGVQLGVYDDPRLAATDPYAAGKGLSWNTTGLVLVENTFAGGTGLLLDTNRTSQISAPGMFAHLDRNAISGAQAIRWCPAVCTRYPTVAAFAAGTGFPFGTVGAAGPSGSPSSSPPGGTTGPSKSASPPAAGSPAPGQYLADPGFEAVPLWWRTFGSATSLAPATTARTGRHALRISQTSSGAAIAGTTGTSRTLRTVAGHRYAASCWVRAAGGLSLLTARLQLQEYTLSGQQVAAPGQSDPVVLFDPTQWYRLSVTYTAARTGDQLPLSVYAASLAAAGPAMLVDDCSLTNG